MLDYNKISQLFRELADAFDGEVDGQTFADDVPDDNQAPDDPWADDAQPSQSQRQSQPRQGNNAGASGQRQSGGSGGRSGPPTQGTFTDDRGKTWTFGKHGAKTCDHNMPAALVSGEKNGKTWKAWACPLGYGSTWRDKCEMFDFTR